MPKKLSNTEIVCRFKEKFGDFIKIKNLNDIKNMHSEIIFIDKDYGEWHGKIYNVLNGNSSHPERIKEKRKNTCQIRFGVSNVAFLTKKNKLSIEEVKKRVFDITENKLTLDESTYKNTYTKCRFFHDKFGEWWIIPKQIWLYKTKNPRGIFSLEKFKKCQKSLTNTKKYVHWKTGEEIIAVASYEQKVVEYLNKNKIDFDWQIKFDMPDGRKYICDIFLIKENQYIEIKGFFWKDALEKWTWFHKEYPNSELWDKAKLKKIGILS